ncbi:hypothetical protein HJFPF1_12210 [Paramyrothecium foliicola]|nr:hypothetical protein HJFPF1_12210 [Paramyrothecium foliicola]
MSVSPLFPSPTVTLGISVPASLRKEIMTAVPPSVVVQLMMNSAYRESLASDFQNDKTPSWYEDLRPELKSFFQDMADSIADGSAVITRTATSSEDPPSGQATQGSEGSSDSADDEGSAAYLVADKSLLTMVIGLSFILGVALAL